MPDLIAIFVPYISDLFIESAEFIPIPNNRIRVDAPNPMSKSGFKTGQSIVLYFEPQVVKDYVLAINSDNNATLQKYVRSLRRVIQLRMVDYDPDGDKGCAFQIYLDSRATDL